MEYLKKHPFEFSFATFIIGTAISCILTFVKPKWTLQIPISALIILIIAFIIAVVIMYLENKSLKNSQTCFSVTKIIKRDDCNAIILTNGLKAYEHGTAISIYTDEEGYEKFLYHGVIVGTQSDDAVQILIPYLNVNDLEQLLNKYNWSKYKIKTTFPYYLFDKVNQQNALLFKQLEIPVYNQHIDDNNAVEIDRVLTEKVEK